MASTSTAQDSAGIFRSQLTEFLQERIRTRAYEIYLRRGGEHGRALDDWLQAEKELTVHGPCAPAVRPPAESRVRPRKSRK